MEKIAEVIVATTSPPKELPKMKERIAKMMKSSVASE